MYIGTRHLHRINKWSAQTVVRNEIGRVGTVTISSIDDIVLDRCKYGILNIAFLVFIIFVRYQEMFSLYFFSRYININLFCNNEETAIFVTPLLS